MCTKGFLNYLRAKVVFLNVVLKDEIVKFSTNCGIINVRPEKIPIFSKKGKIVISVKIRNFFRSRMTKRTFPLKSSYEI